MITNENLATLKQGATIYHKGKEYKFLNFGRCKDITTGEWFESVTYEGVETKYGSNRIMSFTRSVESFCEEFDIFDTKLNSDALFLLINKRPCSESNEDCMERGKMQLVINHLIQGLLRKSPESAKILAEMTDSMPLMRKNK